MDTKFKTFIQDVVHLFQMKNIRFIKYTIIEPIKKLRKYLKYYLN